MKKNRKNVPTPKEYFISEGNRLKLNIIGKGFPDVFGEIDNKIFAIYLKNREEKFLSYYQYKTSILLEKTGILVCICFNYDLNSIYQFNSFLDRRLQQYNDNNNRIKKLPLLEIADKKMKEEMLEIIENHQIDKRRKKSNNYKEEKGKEDLDRLSKFTI